MKLYADIAFRRRIPQANDGLFTFSVPENFHKKIKKGCLVEAAIQGKKERAVVLAVHKNKPLFHTEEIDNICTPELLDETSETLARKVAKKIYVPMAKVIPLFFPTKIFEGNGTMPQVQILSLQHQIPEKMGSKMKQVVEVLQTEKECERMDLQKKAGCSKATIDKMLEKEILHEEWKNAFEPQKFETNDLPLSTEQEAVKNKIISEKKSLLFAATGSGKTHTLQQTAIDVLRTGKNVILLVPEIGLTEELTKKCETVFGAEHVAIFHSRLSEGEKAQVFWRVKSGHAKVVVGSRASLFLPFQNLGLVAVEEEHEWTLKSEQSPRYHARNVAEFLAEIHNCPLVFSSATPSVETYSRSVLPPHEKGELEGVSGIFGTEKTKHIPYNPEITEKARENRKNPTEPEKKIWNILTQKNFEKLKFTRQKPIGNYIADFYCAELGIIIEIDGDSHALQEKYDEKRTHFFESFGLQVVRYTNPEVMKSLEGVYEDLLKKIEERKKELKNITPLAPLLRGEETRISFLHLPSRFPPAKITVVDMNEEAQAKNFSPFSNALLKSIEKKLAEKKQVLLLLNRRGMFRVLMCKQCGEITRCPECNIALTTHHKNGKTFLLCHHCGKVFGNPSACMKCKSTELENRGNGTANIERLLQNMFPQEKVVRIDRDTTSGKKDFEDLYEDFNTSESGILVGTQMIAKGIDFSRIGLVGIINADEGMHIPDFRAQEKTYALLRQACGRAGRRGQEAEGIVQTRMPDLPLFEFLKSGDTQGFLEQELKNRKAFGLPPAKKMIKFIFSAPRKEASFANARKTQQLLQQTAKKIFPEENVLVSAAPALNPYKHKKFFVNVLLNAKHPDIILEKTHIAGCRIDVDPIDTVG